MEKKNEKKNGKINKEEFYIDLSKKLEKCSTPNQYVDLLNKHIRERSLKEKNEILNILELCYEKLQPSGWEFSILLFDKLYTNKRFDVVSEFISGKAIQFFISCNIAKQQINDFKFDFEYGDFLTRESVYTKFIEMNEFSSCPFTTELPIKEQKGTKEKTEDELTKERYNYFIQMKIVYSFIIIAVEFSKQNEIYRDLQLVIIKNYSGEKNDEKRRSNFQSIQPSVPKTYTNNFVSSYINIQRYDEIFETTKFLFNDILNERNQLINNNENLKKYNNELFDEKKVVLSLNESLNLEVENLKNEIISLKNESIVQQDIHNKTEQMLNDEGERSSQIIKDTRIGLIRKVKGMLDLDLNGILEVAEYLEDIDKKMIVKYIKRINDKLSEIEEK
ncbi:MAG: hypothetical protein R3Y60_02515 [bacterium]